MKHNKDYKFSNDVESVRDVVQHLSDLGWDYRYLEYISMADGTTHKFVKLNSCQHMETPDLETALAWVTGDVYMLKELYENGVLVENK